MDQLFLEFSYSLVLLQSGVVALTCGASCRLLHSSNGGVIDLILLLLANVLFLATLQGLIFVSRLNSDERDV